MQTLEQYGLTERDSQTIFGVLQKYSDEVSRAVLFGSRAKGVYHKGSDIDLALDGNSITFKTLRNIKSDLEDSSLPYNLDVVAFATLSNQALKEHIGRVGKVIWHTSEFVEV
ncbi:MAG: nucleotidyltransferase domain-containing protein [Tannerella sp.]|jgi:predicted nucleotidyltransferase|nr:nucleotidyltransferase domain-containing protein [Tannerella sp.]